MGKKSKRVRTKQTKEENNKVKATLIAKLKIGVVSGLRYSPIKATKQNRNSIMVKTGKNQTINNLTE